MAAVTSCENALYADVVLFFFSFLSKTFLFFLTRARAVDFEEKIEGHDDEVIFIAIL